MCRAPFYSGSTAKHLHHALGVEETVGVALALFATGAFGVPLKEDCLFSMRERARQVGAVSQQLIATSSLRWEWQLSIFIAANLA